MIVLDTSALVAILLKEPERDQFMLVIAADEARSVSAVTILETHRVMHGRYGVPGVTDLEQLLDEIAPEIVSFDAAQAAAAFAAFASNGKGINPATRLNICDCVVYALARSRNAPLLFKGDDFRSTDVVPAI